MNKWTKSVRRCLPSGCLLCAAAAGEFPNLCDACVADLPLLQSACPGCAVPLPASIACPACQRRPAPFQRSYASFHYKAPIDRLIHLMKFQGKLAACETLGVLMARRLLAALDERPQVIVPVPLHPSRLRQRGYNQALELARPISEHLKVPLAVGLVSRSGSPVPQTALPSAAERRRNVRRAFTCASPVRGIEQAAVVDDVVTTGATVSEAVRALRRAGVQRVDVWSCARAPGLGS